MKIYDFRVTHLNTPSACGGDDLFGARVSFDSGQNGRLLGTLLKFNRKTVTVVTDNGQKWNISPHLLSPVKDVKPTQSFVYANEKQIE
jgi:hypothetical protein